MGKLPGVPQIMLVLVFMFVIAVEAAASTRPLAPRRVVSLDGTWQVEQGSTGAQGQTGTLHFRACCRSSVEEIGTSVEEIGTSKRGRS
jgi:hypothetical protein